MERWLADELEIKHSIYIHGMGQSMLEAPKSHTVGRTTRQIQDDEFTIDGIIIIIIIIISKALTTRTIY